MINHSKIRFNIISLLVFDIKVLVTDFDYLINTKLCEINDKSSNYRFSEKGKVIEKYIIRNVKISFLVD